MILRTVNHTQFEAKGLYPVLPVGQSWAMGMVSWMGPGAPNGQDHFRDGGSWELSVATVHGSWRVSALTQARRCEQGLHTVPVYGDECGLWGVEGGNGPSRTTDKQEEKLPPQAPQPSLNKCDFCASSHGWVISHFLPLSLPEVQVNPRHLQMAHPRRGPLWLFRED